eukprot:15463813-Alexandrium_andersonii.AAC.1
MALATGHGCKRVCVRPLCRSTARGERPTAGPAQVPQRSKRRTRHASGSHERRCADVRGWIAQ